MNKKEASLQARQQLPRLLDIGDVMWMLHLPAPKVWQMIETGDFLPPILLADQKRWRRQDVERFLRTKSLSVYRLYLDGQQRRVEIVSPEPVSIPPGLEPFQKNLLEFHEFPPCVYFLIASDRIMYIGKSRQLSKRILSHRLGNRKHNTPPRMFDRVLYIPLPLETIAGVEIDFIHKFHPPWNVQGLC